MSSISADFRKDLIMEIVQYIKASVNNENIKLNDNVYRDTSPYTNATDSSVIVIGTYNPSITSFSLSNISINCGESDSDISKPQNISNITINSGDKVKVQFIVDVDISVQ